MIQVLWFQRQQHGGTAKDLQQIQFQSKMWSKKGRIIIKKVVEFLSQLCEDGRKSMMNFDIGGESVDMNRDLL